MSSKSKGSNNVKLQERITVSIIFILFFDLFTIYLSKYSRKNLSIMEFNPESIGNILNFASVIVPVIGLVALMYINRADNRKYYAFLVITILMNIPLLFALLFKQIRFPIPIEYLFGYPLERIYVGAFYLIYQL